MKQRLQTLLTTENLPSSKFADILGVNRSSISHLLTGRNNPSLDFLQKVLIKFPHINPDWLLIGQGSMYRNNKEDKKASITANKLPFKEDAAQPLNISQKDKEEVISNPEKEEVISNPIQNTGKEIPNSNIENKDSSEPQNTCIKKKVEKIVFFYTDGTFKTYNPE